MSLRLSQEKERDELVWMVDAALIARACKKTQNFLQRRHLWVEFGQEKPLQREEGDFQDASQLHHWLVAYSLGNADFFGESPSD